jgi:GLPGLI family protein
MKKILLALLCLLPLALSAQLQNEGTIRYLKTHNWAKMMYKLDYMSKQARERIMYQWGNRSEWKQYCVLHFNQNETKYEESEEKAEPDDEGGYSWRKEAYFIKRNFEKQRTFEVHEMLGKTYIVDDTLRGLDWKIQNDLKEVAGHICMKAVYEDTLRKHKIEAWFAQDIPLSGGPERFYGLPGLILEVIFNEDALILTADKIDYKKLTTELDTPKKLKGKRVVESQLNDVVREHIEDRKKAEQPWFWSLRY